MVEIYYAGCEPKEYRKIVQKEGGNILMSYYHIDPKERAKKTFEFPNKLFIDSGAFSAWSLKGYVNIDQYIHFCKMTNASYYAVLDKIGSAEGTFENQKYMESKGVNPLPCFHYGEDFKWLDMYCKEYDYVCLGGMVPIHTNDLRKWLDIIFSKYPNQKFHGFGMTTFSLIKRYPWHSIDSSSWVTAGAKYGELIDDNLGTIYFGEVKDNLEWGEEVKKRGFTIKEMDDYMARCLFNYQTYSRYQGVRYNLKERQIQLGEGYNFPSTLFKPKKKEKAVQRTLINLSLGYKKKIKKIVMIRKCLSCDKGWEFKPDEQKECRYCGDNMVTSPIKTEVITYE